MGFHQPDDSSDPGRMIFWLISSGPRKAAKPQRNPLLLSSCHSCHLVRDSIGSRKAAKTQRNPLLLSSCHLVRDSIGSRKAAKPQRNPLLLSSCHSCHLVRDSIGSRKAAKAQRNPCPSILIILHSLYITFHSLSPFLLLLSSCHRGIWISTRHS